MVKRRNSLGFWLGVLLAAMFINLGIYDFRNRFYPSGLRRPQHQKNTPTESSAVVNEPEAVQPKTKYASMQEFYDAQYKARFFSSFDPFKLEREGRLVLVDSSADLIPECERQLKYVPEKERLPTIETFTTAREIVERGHGHFGHSMLRMKLRDAEYGFTHVNQPRLFGLRSTCEGFYQNLHIAADSRLDADAQILSLKCEGADSDLLKYRYALRDVEHILPLSYMSPFLTCTRNATITSHGHLLREHYSYQQQGHCWHDRLGDDGGPDAPYYDKVFTINQYWGAAFYHALAETMPRIAYYYEYLMEHKDIKILAGSIDFPARVLEFMGFEKDRIIQGAVRTGIAFEPEPTVYCGNPNVLGIQKLQLIFQQRLKYYYPEIEDEIRDAKPLILIIKRTRGRYLFNHEDLESRLRKRFSNFNVEVFSDEHVPTFAEILRMFYRASVVIGPHGAGLTNIMVCRAGTVVIEYHGNPPNYCYAAQSILQHLKYFGNIADPRSSIDGEIYAGIDDAVNIIQEFGQVNRP